MHMINTVRNDSRLKLITIAIIEKKLLSHVTDHYKGYMERIPQISLMGTSIVLVCDENGSSYWTRLLYIDSEGTHVILLQITQWDMSLDGYHWDYFTGTLSSS